MALYTKVADRRHQSGKQQAQSPKPKAQGAIPMLIQQRLPQPYRPEAEIVAERLRSLQG